jgi:DUF4097 and DUF4098 domain-containing protein YvlB
MRLTRILPIAALLLATVQVAQGADFPAATERFAQDMTLDVGGSFLIENAFGSVEVIGTDGPGLSIVAQKIVKGVDKAAIEEGRAQTDMSLGGDARFRVIKSVFPATRSTRWTSSINYQIRVPRTVHVKIGTHSSERVHVANIGGNVFIKNVNGLIVLERITGATTVESINGSIVFDTAKPSANVGLSTVNGQIEVRVDADANFRWAADTIKGDYRTTLPVRGRFDGTSFRGTVNAPDGPTITTASMMGNIYLLSKGSNSRQAESVRARAASMMVPIPAPIISAAIQKTLVQGSFTYETTIGNVAIGEIRGNARIITGAGEVQLGAVTGECYVNSLGGPLHLGDIFGPLTARTRAGDILVHAARDGGSITSGGGTIRLLYNSGPTSLDSAGGDIIVSQAAGAIDAETKSGDITITVDPTVKSERISAKTSKGNVTLNIPPGFGADLEMTILTEDPEKHVIRSDFHGLSLRRDQVGSKTRIQATAKLNGGGERVVLSVEDGGIQLSTRSGSGLQVISPK